MVPPQAGILIPQTLLFLPLYALVFRLRLDDNVLAFALVYPTLAVPFCVWLLSAYFQRLPPDVEDSAYTGVNLAAFSVVPVAAGFAGAYVRGLTAAMVEGA